MSDKISAVGSQPLVSSEPDVILDAENICKIKSQDPNAKLILKYNDELVQKICVKNVKSTEWRLKSPNNPHLKGYRLVIKSQKFVYILQKLDEDLPLHNVIETIPIVPLYKKVQTWIKNLSAKTFAIFFAALAIFEFAYICFYLYKVAISEFQEVITQGLSTEDDGGLEYSDKEKSPEIELPPVLPEITIDYVRWLVECQKYDGHDLSIDKLENFLSFLPKSEQKREEAIRLHVICKEIKNMQSGKYENEDWYSYNRNNNILRENTEYLYRINNRNYEYLRHALAPLYQHDDYDRSGPIVTFQKKYIPLECNTPNSAEVKSFKAAKTFKDIRKLFDNFLREDINRYEEVY